MPIHFFCWINFSFSGFINVTRRQENLRKSIILQISSQSVFSRRISKPISIC
ncbi:hypothetical protein Lalb_Chr12g0204331 [Lupinus albus]|uniref:Uncharacterized protein n=1 Tax=Lupinus albus TaxID=3870 RepID=A0A6A4PMW4_LUPAL|nr:hypothetical protein Lalb_Chr12g0204331 [Lupinus albus]